LVGSSVSFRLIYCLENTVAGLPTGIKLLRIRTTIIAKIITREFREGLNMMFRLIIRASGYVSIGGFCREGNNPFDLTASNYRRIFILK
jgi:hypothetical protein